VPRSVLITAVPPLTRTGSGHCNRAPAGDQTANVTSSEAAFLDAELRAPLNGAISGAAEEHDWNLVDAHLDDFVGHAICQSSSSARWFNTNNAALRMQGDVEQTDGMFGLDFALPDFSAGWIHPNKEGFEQTGGALYRDLSAELVERFRSSAQPLFTDTEAGGFTVSRAFVPPVASRSGNYWALRLLAVDASGRNSVVTGADGFRLLGYGTNSTEYSRTGRYLIVGRACAPLARDASAGCGPAFAVRASTLVPPVPIGLRAEAPRPTPGGPRVSVTAVWRHSDAGAAHDTTRSRVRVTGEGLGGAAVERTITVNGRRTAGAVSDLLQGEYEVSVQACNGNRCSAFSSPVRATPGSIDSFDPAEIRIDRYGCDRSRIAWVPPRQLPGRDGTDGAIILADPYDEITAPCLAQPVGQGSGGISQGAVSPGTFTGATIGWEHPLGTQELRTIEARFRVGSGTVATVVYNANQNTVQFAGVARAAARKIKLGAKRRTLKAGPIKLRISRRSVRRPRTATGRLSLRLQLAFGRSLAGRRVKIDVGASDDRGTRQPFVQRASIRVRRK
ncbi:MAG: hypothetical protein ACRDJY_00255, partial [Thermoleophilaceae bacterium]